MLEAITGGQMKINEVVELMSKTYLHRIIDSFTKDFPKHDENKSKSIILANSKELIDKNRFENVLKFDCNYSNQLLLKSIIEVIITTQEFFLNEVDIIDYVQKYENEIIEKSELTNIFQYQNELNIEILYSVLEVALEDSKISNEELNLIRKLQEKLELSDTTLRLILAKLNNFPKKENEIHSINDFKDALLKLQKKGILFYCNKLNNGVYVIPEEFIPIIRKQLNIELSKQSFYKLLSNLKKAYLSKILENLKIPKSGKSEDLINRILNLNIKPSTALNLLSNSDLHQICTSLPGVKSSGIKEDRISRIIDYYAKKIIKDLPKDIPEEEKYYKYIIELAHRDRETLLSDKIINKDKDMELAFEAATRYLFSNKLGIDLINMPGNEHPDGCFELKRSSELLMWDNKSIEKSYDFPESHLKQFKRYIRDSITRVSCFLVIVPEIEDSSVLKAHRLKVESNKDTDIGLITAENLLWVAENWKDYSKNATFDPEVFNYTGILDRQILELRMKLFLK